MTDEPERVGSVATVSALNEQAVVQETRYDRPDWRLPRAGIASMININKEDKFPFIRFQVFKGSTVLISLNEFQLSEGTIIIHVNFVECIRF